MNYNKLLRFIVILLLIVINLYFFRRISFEIGRIIFNNSNFGILEILEKGQKRILLQFIIDIVYIVLLGLKFRLGDINISPFLFIFF